MSISTSDDLSNDASFCSHSNYLLDESFYGADFKVEKEVKYSDTAGFKSSEMLNATAPGSSVRSGFSVTIIPTILPLAVWPVTLVFGLARK